MKTRILLAILALSAVLYSGSASAQPLSLGQISDYLNDLGTAEGRFTQLNADGSLSTGQIYIKRPGRIRFEYDAPSDALIMAGGGQLAVFDPRSNTGPERFPLRLTPLNVFLARNVNLGASDMVRDIRSDGVVTVVTAQDPDNPDYGHIELFFTAEPTLLRQWVIVDQSGQRTTIMLNDLETGGRLPERLFNILGEMRRRGDR